MIEAKQILLAAILAAFPIGSIAAAPPVAAPTLLSAGLSRAEAGGVILIKHRKGGDGDADDRDRDDRGGGRHHGGGKAKGDRDD